MNDNPYQSPQAGDEEVSRIAIPETVRFEEVGRIVVMWEKLRLIYNAIGAVPTLLMAVSLPISIGELVGYIIVANVCFCVGPVLDSYLTWFGFRSKAVTVLLFVLGTCAMLALAAGVASSYCTFD